MSPGIDNTGERLRAALSDETRVVVLHGEAGTGKTTLWRSVVTRLEHEFPGGVGEMGPIMPPTPPVRQRRIDAALSSYRGRRGRTLFVMDDAEVSDLDIVTPMIAREPHIKVLIVARSGLPRRYLGEIMPPVDGVSAKFIRMERISWPVFMRALEELRASGRLEQDVLQQMYSATEGNPAAISAILRWTSSLGRPLDSSDVAPLLVSTDRPTIYGPDSRPLDPHHKSAKEIVLAVKAIDDAMIRRFAADPSLLYNLDPRKFEELVAELAHREGYQVELTPQTRDGGVDIVAIKQDGLARFLCLVECKRYAPDRPVGIEIVQRLGGNVHGRRANVGTIVTTSYFSSDAIKVREHQFPNQISLQDYLALQTWLDKASGRRPS